MKNPLKKKDSNLNAIKSLFILAPMVNLELQFRKGRFGKSLKSMWIVLG
jgi:hypothetical protein